jgi:alpha-beta hydrolase superfamily lysophospholipase
LALVLVLAACTADDDTADDPSRPGSSEPAASQPAASQPAASQPDPSQPAASQPDPSRPDVGETYRVPDQHPSDWAAPAVELPDAPRPYGPSPEATADPAFYDVTTLDPAEVAASEPGTVLRSEAVELTGPLEGASGWRVLYRSTTADDEPAVVSGILLVPEGPAPSEGRPVAAWAHGTTGIADRCAPSTTGNLFYDDYGQVGRDLLDQGFVVAATDYHGLGTPGVHSYHRSEELARATIDSVRAVHTLDDVGPLTPQWVTIGHSEGGLTVLAVDERLDLAPADLDYRGSVVAAPSAQLARAAPLLFTIEGRGYGAFLLEALAEVEPRLDPAVAMGPEAAKREPLLTHGCWEEAVPGFDDIDPADMLASPEISDLLGEVLTDYAGYDPTEATGPMLVVQGEADDAVPPPLTADLVEQLCSAGVAVESRTYPGTGHDEVMAASLADSSAWFSARLAGEDPTSSCATG